jgi:signal transduction histidine kinase
MAEDSARTEERVLLVAPTRRDAEVTCRLLGDAGIACLPCADLPHLAAEIGRGTGAVVLTDLALAAPGIDAFLARLGEQPSWSDIPVVLLIRDKDYSYEARHSLGAFTNVTLLDLPASTRSMLSAVQAALRSRRRQYENRDRIARQAEAEEALRDADQRKDEFLATLAHELRNPLATIRNCLPLLMQGPSDPELTRRLVGMMDRQSRLLVKLIDDLLDVSRIATGKVRLRRERLDLRAVVESALEMGQTALDAAHHAISVELPPGPVWVLGDHERLGQVVSNVLNNAVKYTPDGGRIVLTLAQEASDAVVRIADNGAGLPPELVPSVFDLFTQVNRTLDRSQGGLGIGLSLVKRLTELHGGSVGAASEGIDRGSTFTIRLPLHAPQAHASAPHGGDGANARAIDPPAKRLKVLVVDDNPDVADSLAVLLMARGHAIRTEYAGASGLEAAEEFAPDIVFCDIGMPGIDGHQLAKALRAKPRFAATLLVAVTGWGSEDHQRRTRQAGFDLHLTKPASLEAVDAILARV